MSYSLAFTQAIAILIRIGTQIRFKGHDYVSTSDLSKDLGIPRPTTVNILTRLTHAEVIETKEGINGGVRLSHEPEEITLLQILDAVEAQKSLFRTSIKTNIATSESEIARSKVIQYLGKAENALKDELSKVNIASLFAC